MNTWIALLRGINVGGRNRLPMKDLAAIMESAGCEEITTYIQSGNVVFKADIGSASGFADEIGKMIEKAHGFCPAILLLSAAELEAAIAANPYPQAVDEPKTLHLNFLWDIPDDERVTTASQLLAASESFTIEGKVLYFHAPDGIGRSKFAAGIDRALKGQMTGRNWRTVTKLEEIVATK